MCATVAIKFLKKTVVGSIFETFNFDLFVISIDFGGSLVHKTGTIKLI